MALSLAGAVRVSPRYRRVSLHGFDAVAPHSVVVDQIAGPNAQHFLDFALTHWRGAWFWPFRAGMARTFGSGPGFSAGIAVGDSTLAMARSSIGFTGISSPIMDGELD